MAHRGLRLLTCWGLFGLLVTVLTVPTPNLAADKPAKTEAKGKNKKSGKASSAASRENDSHVDEADDDSDPPKKIVKTDAEWKKQLTPLQFRVTRRKATEQAGTGIYAHSKKDGIYRCVCCDQPLFDSKTKFESGTGWPSFFQSLSSKAVAYHDDHSTDELRTEVECSRCDAHLGHVFEDGPAPTGLRYCMNSAALHFVPRDVYEKETKAKKESAKESKDSKDDKSKKSASGDSGKQDKSAKPKST